MGRANKGSQFHLQNYVNENPRPIAEAIQSGIAASGGAEPGNVKWLSPLAGEDYVEYQDGAFLRVLGLGQHAAALGEFWPKGGPVWDGLATVEVGGGKQAVVLVEAKSHAPEMESTCAAVAKKSRDLIEQSLARTKEYVGADPAADWLSPYYQYANRLAHLYFLAEVCDVEAYLAFVYFCGDTEMGGPMAAEDWRPSLIAAETALGLGDSHALAGGVLDVMLSVSS